METKPKTEKATFRLPVAQLEALDRLVEAGVIRSRQDGIFEAIRDFAIPEAWKLSNPALLACAEFLAEMVRSDILPDELAENARELLAKTTVEV